MENASKALIIAGAILLSILIIALGMNVFNMASGIGESANMDAQEIDTHNKTFTDKYEGKRKGNIVRSLLSDIAANNEKYDDRIIKVTFTPSTTSSGTASANALSEETDPAEIRKSMNGLKTTTSYRVQFVYGGTDGLINECTIEVYSSATTTTP